jgi:hypothetical protein
VRLRPGELLCGAAHDILTRSALVRVATRRHVKLRPGRNARSTAGGRRALRSWAGRKLTRILIIAVLLNLCFSHLFAPNPCQLDDPHRQVIEPHI